MTALILDARSVFPVTGCGTAIRPDHIGKPGVLPLDADTDADDHLANQTVSELIPRSIGS